MDKGAIYVLLNHNNGDHFTCECNIFMPEDIMTLGESLLIFHWCLYDKVQYSCTYVKGFHETPPFWWCCRNFKTVIIHVHMETKKFLTLYLFGMNK